MWADWRRNKAQGYSLSDPGHRTYDPGPTGTPGHWTYDPGLRKGERFQFDKGKGDSDQGKGDFDQGKGDFYKGKGDFDKGKGRIAPWSFEPGCSDDFYKGKGDFDQGDFDKGKGYFDKGKGYFDQGKGDFDEDKEPPLPIPPPPPPKVTDKPDETKSAEQSLSNSSESNSLKSWTKISERSFSLSQSSV